MNDLINASLEATVSASKPIVVSENHNLSSINFVAGLSDPGEMIRCGYRPELRRQAGEQDTEYANRIRPLVMSLPQQERDIILKAAIRRAGLDTTNGKVAVMVAGQSPWHGLGVNVKDAVTSADAIRLASMEWQVGKIQQQYKNPITGELVDADDYALCRMDNGKQLGTVGDRYKPFQNSEGFAFLDKIIGEFGARYESAGSLYGGKKVWMLVRLPKQEFSVNGTDKVEAYAIFTNTHDGTESAKCFPTSQRVVCANTFRLAKKDSDKGISIRHTGNLAGKVASAQAALGLAVEEFNEFRVNSEVLSVTKVDPIPYFNGLLDVVCDITVADSLKGADALAAALAVTNAEIDMETERKRVQRMINTREGLLEDIIGRYESDRCGVNGMRGTGWAALNAVTEASDFGKLGGRTQGEDKSSRRFESVLNGAADEVKQLAYSQVMEYLKA